MISGPIQRCQTPTPGAPPQQVMGLELIDICFNFTHDAFRRDEEAVLERAAAAGVNTLLVTGSSVPDSELALRLAEGHPGRLYATAGVHPHLAREWCPDTIPRLRELADHPRVCAIGETGLDYHRNFSTPEEQRRAFAAQIRLAADLDMPLFLHERDAHLDFLAMLRERRADLGPMVVHCFTGSGDQLAAYLDLDLHIGLTGWICDERRGHHLHPLIRHIPLERLMVETDAPYLTPRDLRPQPRDRRNEPAFLPHIVDTVARILDRKPEEIARATTATARRFYGLPS